MIAAAHDRFVLTFHGTGPRPSDVDAGEAAVWCDVPTLERVLDRAAGDPRVRVTVDDGRRSDVEILLPRLLERGLAATCFACAGRIGVPGFTGAADLALLHRHGIAIGLHGDAHVPWRGLDDRAARREIEDARARLEEVVGAPVREAACPFGAYDRRTIVRLREAGIDRIHTSDGGWSREHDDLVARTTVRPDTADAVLATLDAGPGGGALPRRLRRRVVMELKRWR